MIRYPLGIPTTLVVQMASVSHVYMEAHVPSAVPAVWSEELEDVVITGDISHGVMSNTLRVEGDVRRVIIFNSVGKLMLSAEGRDEIDVRSLTAGLYLIKVSGRNGSSIVRKMLVTR